MRLFVDTCVWRYWLTLKNNKQFENDVLENHAKEFDQVYKIVLSEPLKHVFLYNARIEGELPDSYLSELPISFSKIKTNSNFIKTAIPLSRYDGTYKADGSVLAGGRFGGVLRDILSLDGHNHQYALKTAAPNYKLENAAHTGPRKKEFDVEHLESALEADADLFITTDQPLVDRLSRAVKSLKDNSAVTRAYEICVEPGHALNRLKLI